MSTPTQFIVSIPIDSVIEALGSFIQIFVGPVDIVRAEVNRVAPPRGPFVELTELLQSDLEYPTSWYVSEFGQRNILGPKEITVQADFYGPLAGDWCSAVKQAFRTPYGVSLFPTGIAPLYTDNGRQSPLITGEEQYLRRWTLTLCLQYNPITTVPEQAASSLKMNIVQDVNVEAIQ